jgi:predicted metallopeptidase
MGRTTRTYDEVPEALTIAQDLCNKYPDVFWAVNPETIAVLGIDNVERSEKAAAKNNVWSQLRNIKGVEGALLAQNKINVKYVIELYWSDWNRWSHALKTCVVAEKLLEITPEVDKKNSPDCKGFKILLDAIGITWDSKDGNPPDLLSDGGVKFDLELRPGLNEESEDEG